MGKDKDINDLHPTPEEIEALEEVSNILDFQKEVEDRDPEARYARELNEKHLFINSYGGKSAVTYMQYNEVTERDELNFVTIETFKNMYLNRSIQIGRAAFTLGQWWLQHSGRNTVSGVIFDPSEHGQIIRKNNNKYLNLWEGFSVGPKKGSWYWTSRHIYRILCNSDKQKFLYVIKWLAWMVQNPDKQAEVAIVFKGKKGSGKSFLFEEFKTIFGSHGMVITDPTRLTGKHTAHFSRLCFVFCDEVYDPDDKAIEGRMKAIITAPYLDVEGKFKDAVTSKNRMHIAMATNNDKVIKAGADERRYFIETVSNRYAKGEASEKIRQLYFSRLFNEMDRGGREAMLYDLLKIDLKGWHPRFNIPETSELEKQKLMSLNSLEQAARILLEEGQFPGELSKYQKYMVPSDTILNYIDKLEPMCSKFSMVRKTDMLKKLGATKSREGGTGRSRWEFPELDKMRQKWDKEYGRYMWDDVNKWEIIKTEF